MGRTGDRHRQEIDADRRYLCVQRAALEWSAAGAVVASTLHTTKVTSSKVNAGRRWRGPGGLRGPETGGTVRMGRKEKDTGGLTCPPKQSSGKNGVIDFFQ